MSADTARIDRLLLAAALLASLAVPLFLTGYNLGLATRIVVYSGLAATLGFLVGVAGLVSLGHAAFFGIAAYTLALMAPKEAAANVLITLPAAMLVAGAAALVIGLVSLRNKGLYFILVTLAFGQLLFHFFHDTRMAGGSDGIYVAARPEISLGIMGSLSIEKKPAFHLFAVAVVALVFAAIAWARATTGARVLLAAQRDESRLLSLGHAPRPLQLAAFVLMGMLAGAVGYVHAADHGHVVPELLGWHFSATVLVMVLIGGKDTLSGPAVGALVLILVEEWLQRLPLPASFDWLAKNWKIGEGLIVVAVVMLAPSGLVPVLARLQRPRGGRHA